MTHTFNALSEIEPDFFAIGICPICCRRLAAECEHSQTQEAQEWYAAQIVAEQELQNEKHAVEEAYQIDHEWEQHCREVEETRASDYPL